MKYLLHIRSKYELDGVPICASRRGMKIMFDTNCQQTLVHTPETRKLAKQFEKTGTIQIPF